MSRVKNSIGSYSIHPGTGNVVELNSSKYAIDYSRKFFLFDVIPMGAVRMSSSDRWKVNPNHKDPRKRQREPVTRYFAFKDRLKTQSQELGFQLGELLDIVFFVPMPDAWSEKKKQRSIGLPCKVRPDVDNMVKGVMDCLKSEDGDVWYVRAEKRYAWSGSILIYA